MDVDKRAGAEGIKDEGLARIRVATCTILGKN